MATPGTTMAVGSIVMIALVSSGLNLFLPRPAPVVSEVDHRIALIEGNLWTRDDGLKTREMIATMEAHVASNQQAISQMMQQNTHIIQQIGRIETRLESIGALP